jgi:hypothetical protein
MLPRWYRVGREDEMAGTFVADRHDDVDLEYGWPGWAEARAVAVLAVRTRLAGAGGPPRALAVGAAVRLVALLGLVAHAALATAWALATLPAVLDRGIVAVLRDGALLPGAVALAAVPALLLLLGGRRAAAKVFAAVAVVPGVVALVGAVVAAEVWYAPAGTAAAGAPLWLPVACLFVGFHREAPSPPARPWLLATAAATGLTGSWVALVHLVGNGPRLLPVLGALPAGAVVAGAVVCLVARRRAGAGRTLSWTLAVAACAAVALCDHLAVLLWAVAARADLGPTLYLSTVPPIAGTAVVALVLGVVGRRDLRRLPTGVPVGPRRSAEPVRTG